MDTQSPVQPQNAVIPQPQVSPVQIPVQPVQPMGSAPMVPVTKKKLNPLFIVLPVLLLIIAAVVGVIVFMMMNSNNLVGKWNYLSGTGTADATYKDSTIEFTSDNVLKVSITKSLDSLSSTTTATGSISVIVTATYKITDKKDTQYTLSLSNPNFTYDLSKTNYTAEEKAQFDTGFQEGLANSKDSFNKENQTLTIRFSSDKKQITMVNSDGSEINFTKV